MRDAIIAAVRTAVQVGVASVVAWLAAKGIEVDSALLEGAAFSIVAGVVTFALNQLQAKVPFVGTVLSFGLSKSTPTY